MRPRLDRLTRQFLPVLILGASACVAADPPVPNELNTAVEEPLINLPEVDATSPFHSISRPRNVTPTDQQDRLIKLVEDAVDSTRRRLLDTDINSPWQIMHGLLALRREFQVRHEGQIVSGLDWVSSGPSFEGEPWFEKTPYGGRAHPYSRPWAFEGHANQFLAVLSMSALPLDHEFQTQSGPVTIAQMVQHAQKSISTKDEPTWTLWALSRYLPPDATWRNNRGENWSIERLVSIQTAKPLKGTACGGTHGMFALAHARNVYLRSGQPLRGVWLEAEYKIRRQINTTRVQQNPNGMLSSNYFRGREYKRDFNKRMASAGHLLEFLMISLPQDELEQRWVRRAIEATAQDLLKNRKAEVRCSPLYHAVNALNIYLDRVQVAQPAEVVSTEQNDAQLTPVDEKTAVRLKSVPATRISTSQPVMTEVEPQVTAAEETDDAAPKPDEKTAKESAAKVADTDTPKEPKIAAAEPSAAHEESADTSDDSEGKPTIRPAPGTAAEADAGSDTDAQSPECESSADCESSAKADVRGSVDAAEPSGSASADTPAAEADSESSDEKADADGTDEESTDD